MRHSRCRSVYRIPSCLVWWWLGLYAVFAFRSSTHFAANGFSSSLKNNVEVSWRGGGVDVFSQPQQFLDHFQNSVQQVLSNNNNDMISAVSPKMLQSLESTMVNTEQVLERFLISSGQVLPNTMHRLEKLGGFSHLDMVQQVQQPQQMMLDQIIEAVKSDDTIAMVLQSSVVVQSLQSMPASVQWSVLAILTFGLFRGVFSVLFDYQQPPMPPPPPSRPYPMNRYDALSARRYFDQRPGQVLYRGMEIALASIQFALSIVLDKGTEEERGQELARVLTKLGPTFIKVGQSLSIRTDLLSPGYIRGLETLQDQVPPFDTNIAKQIIQDEWGGIPIVAVLESELTTKPIAAASLGQVYKGKLRSTGEYVAIKVQRPDIMEKIALDMHLLREFGALAKRVGKFNTDMVGTVDAWGTGFVDELDYIQEAANGEFFAEKIKETPLKDVVFTPSIVHEYTTNSVLMTSWVDGQRLDQSSSEDVTALCSIAMNTYLTMLLELGLLHCDPHPGNLLRTPDGKLCILDFGMVTRLDKDLQLTLIEHMAHLTSADYEEIPKDLLKLGFVPESMADKIDDSGVVEVLADIYSAWTSGGGAAAINVNKVIAQMQDLTAKKGNLFQIPPYFAYIAKSFSVLEGIGLKNDPKYSIINECLPYVSQRLLTDHERLGPALSTFIFGPDKAKPDRIVNYRRVEQLIEGFGDYTAATAGARFGKSDLSRTQQIGMAADKILDLVLSEEETPLQAIVLEQTAKIIAAGSRRIWSNVRERSGILPSGRSFIGTLVDPLGLWRTSPLVSPSELDRQTVDTTVKLVDLLRRQNLIITDLDREEVIALASILTRKFWAKRSSLLLTSNRFVRTLLQILTRTLEHGERGTPRKPMPRSERMNNKAVVQNQTPIPQMTVNRKESTRLQNARAILQSFENGANNNNVLDR